MLNYEPFFFGILSCTKITAKSEALPGGGGGGGQQGKKGFVTYQTATTYPVNGDS